MKLNIVLENKAQSDDRIIGLLGSPIHNTLVGLQDYIDSNIVLNFHGNVPGDNDRRFCVTPEQINKNIRECKDKKDAIPDTCNLYFSADVIKNPVLLREKTKEAIDIFYNSLMSDSIGAFTQRELKLDKAFAVNGSELVGAVICDPQTRKIDIVIEKLTTLYKKEFERISETFYLRYFADYGELQSWLKQHLMDIPEIVEWNLRQREYDAGERDANAERPDFPRQDPKNSPEEDFVDLDALIGNTTQHLIRNNIDINFSTF